MMDSTFADRLATAAINAGIYEPGSWGTALGPNSPIISQEARNFAEQVGYLLEHASITVVPDGYWLQSAARKDSRDGDEVLARLCDAACLYAREAVRVDNAHSGRMSKRKFELLQAIKDVVRDKPNYFR